MFEEIVEVGGINKGVVEGEAIVDSNGTIVEDGIIWAFPSSIG